MCREPTTKRLLRPASVRQSCRASAPAFQTEVAVLLILAANVHAQDTSLFLNSEPGDYIGQGVQQTLTTDVTPPLMASYLVFDRQCARVR